MTAMTAWGRHYIGERRLQMMYKFFWYVTIIYTCELCTPMITKITDVRNFHKPGLLILMVPDRDILYALVQTCIVCAVVGRYHHRSIGVVADAFSVGSCSVPPAPPLLHGPLPWRLG